MSESSPRLFYLDLIPDEPEPGVVSGRARRLQNCSPKQCFWSTDLYTTQYFGAPNDEIERFLFGAIDNEGAVAVRAVAGGDPRAIHESFRCFFSYIDAQKMRTHKGLDWIRARYKNLNQFELMREMQALRQMHCTMWLEAVREIVSAEESDVKFIVSDHPVTVFNARCPPGTAQCRYPEDPPIELIGSQTIFSLSANHCLILTNLEYARNPVGADLRRPRQNARHFSNTVARTDAWIRTRKLSTEDVTAINYILKSRARRYIAASEQDWLYPERAGPQEWNAIGKVLLPPEKELWHFGGEIYIGHQDGSSSYQDAFGRTSRGHEYLSKAAGTEEPTSDQLCPCGSGKAFRACCMDLPLEDRTPWDVCSIRERNLMFWSAIEDILGLNRGKSWEDVRRELSDGQVKDIHAAYASLWSKDTNLADLLPRPDTRVCRALYVGPIDPRTIGASVIGWLCYVDEILVVNPFTNAASIRPEYSPIDSPAQYKEQTIKNVALIMTLVPFIHEGVVHLIPDPLEFNDAFREAVWTIAKERRGKVKLDPVDLELGYELGKDDFKRTLARLPDEDLRRQLQKSSPNLADDKITEAMVYIRKEHLADPLALIQPLVAGEGGAQLQVMRGVNFEVAVFLAQLTGAVIYTDQRFTREQLAEAHLLQTDGTTTSDRGLALQIVLDMDPDRVRASRAESSSWSVRASVRALWSAVLADGGAANDDAVEKALREVKDAVGDLVREERGSADASRETRSREMVVETNARLVIPPAGFGLIAVRRFLVAFGRRRCLNAIPFAILFGRGVSPAGQRD